MVTVLVISCPHALGLAIPLVVARSTALSAKNGLFIKNRSGFEEAKRIDTIVFDKTGTLTEGTFGVTDVVLFNKDIEENEFIRLAASIESQSDHPIASRIVAEAQKRNIPLTEPETFDSLTGSGITGQVDGQTIYAVSPGYLKREGITYDNTAIAHLSDAGQTVIFILKDNIALGAIALADVVKESAKEAIDRLHRIGIKDQMLTGDNQKVANAVGEEIGIDEVIAEVLPHQKAETIKKLKKNGTRVGMTGDGINDAPALANADLGIAIGAGTDVAMDTADIVLVNSHPKDVVSIIELSKVTYRKMIQNLWWAAGITFLPSH